MIINDNGLVFVLLKTYNGEMSFTKIKGVFSSFELANKYLTQLYNEELELYNEGSWLQEIKYDESTNSYKFFGDDADCVELKIEAYTMNSYSYIH